MKLCQECVKYMENGEDTCLYCGGQSWGGVEPEPTEPEGQEPEPTDGGEDTKPDSPKAKRRGK